MPRKGKKSDSKAQEEAKYEISGVIRKLDDKSFDMVAVDTRFITVQLSDKTTKPADLKIGDPVRVEATQDDNSVYHALSVTVDPAVAKKMPKDLPPIQEEAPAAPKAAEAQVPEPPERPTTALAPSGPVYDDGDSGPPTLKHGKPRQSARAETVASVAGAGASRPQPAPGSTTSDPDTPEPIPSANPRQELIAKSKEASASFLQGLPNYVCHQVTTRYASGARANDWQPIDMVTTDLVYENGKESYRNLQINGKATKKSPEESGAWSTGEFGTILDDLFSPATAAEFELVKDSTISGLAASVFDYNVERSNSHWKISVPGQFVQPAYKGSIWVDKKTYRVLRIEMQARQIPKEFPEDAVETAVEYQYTTLGTSEKFLLPVHAEVLSCLRGTNSCQRNVIEFRNYHKFSGESTIKFGEPK